jgi:hypothetical protein
MEWHPFYFSFKRYSVQQEDVDENAPIICSKKKYRYVVKKRFEKYCGSILCYLS